MSLKPPSPVTTSVPVPSAPEAAPMEVSTVSETQLEDVQKKSETCPQGHTTGSPDCIVTHYTVKEPVTRTKTTMTFGSHRLTHAQFLTIVEADRPERIVRLEDETAQCKRARIPRYIAIALGAGAIGSLGYAMVTKDSVGTYVGIGLGAGSLASLGIGLGMAKGSCREAKALAHELDLSGKDVDVVHGRERGATIQEKAVQYNQRSGTGAP